MASASANVGGWRDKLSLEDRNKVVQHIFQKLENPFRFVPKERLLEKSNAFESQSYRNAESRADYLKRIANGLANVQRLTEQQSITHARVPVTSGNSTAARTTAPSVHTDDAILDAAEGQPEQGDTELQRLMSALALSDENS